MYHHSFELSFKYRKHTLISHNFLIRTYQLLLMCFQLPRSLVQNLQPRKLLRSPPAESIILSAGSTKQQSTISCSGKCCKNGSGRGNSDGSRGFDVGSSDYDCSEDSNGNGNVAGNSSNEDRTESIMLSAGGAESIILSAPSLKLQSPPKVIA